MADPSNGKRCPNCTLIFLQPGEETGKTRTARVEELLRQNHPPLDVELSDFRQMLENTRAVLENLDSEIVQTRELLDNLLSARQQAQSRLEDTKTILHPMRSIPNELLAEIFGHCILKEYDDFEDPDSLDPRAAPWLLTRVSRRWRNLALSLPQLWTHLFLDFDKHKGHISNHQCLYKVCLFTERSRGLPMTVYLGSNYRLKNHSVLPVLEASISTSLAYDDEDEWGQTLDVFKSASTPVLHRLEVDDDIPWRALEHVAFPWSQLTSITSFPAFDPDGLNRLRSTTDLEELSVVATSAHPPIQNVISLPKLRRLTITESEDAPGRSKEFFSALAIPALSELTLAYDDESVLRFPTSPLSSLGNLIKLDITCDMNAHEENTQRILHFLTLTHHVEILRLQDLNLTAEFCDGLNRDKITDGLPARLPCLQFLDIGDCEFAPTLDHDIDRLFDMLNSRLPAVMTKEEQGEEETANASTVVMDDIGATNETGTLEYDSGARLDSSENHRGYLKKVQIPHRLYVQMRTEWPEVFFKLTSKAELECAFGS